MKITISGIGLDKLETSGMSEQQIAELLGCSRQALYKYRRRIGYPNKRRAFLGARLTDEQKRQRHNNYQKGYSRAHRDGRNGRELRRIASQVLGRRLKIGEVIHHIDHNPRNNSHDNLVICTQSYHISVLHKDRGVAK